LTAARVNVGLHGQVAADVALARDLATKISSLSSRRLDRLRDGSLLGDVGERRFLLIVQRAGERDDPRDAVGGNLRRLVQLDIDVNRAEVPPFARATMRSVIAVQAARPESRSG